jgi:hypothetical protein
VRREGVLMENRSKEYLQRVILIILVLISNKLAVIQFGMLIRVMVSLAV